MYYVKRKGKIKGPLTLEKMQELRDEDRLRMRDEVAESPEGPWARLSDVYDRVFGGTVTGESDGADDDDSFLSLVPEYAPSQKPTPAGGAAAAPPSAAVGTLTLRPWQVAAGIAGVVAFGMFAIILGVVLSPLVSTPKDDEEMAVAEPPPPPPRQAPAAVAPKAAPVAAAVPPPAVKPAAPPLPAVPPPAPALADAAVGAKPAATKPAAPPEPVGGGGPGAVPLDGDHAAAIKAVLAAYYTAAGWEDRYRAVLPGDDVKKTMRSLYDDVDWVAVNWSVTAMPPAAELGKAAAAGRRIRIDTTVNGNPHSVLMAYAGGAWRVDWMESLSTLWLTR